MAVVSIDSDDSKDDEIEKVANFAEAYSLDTTSSIVPITTDTVWYLDSGATRHVTGNRILLKNLVKFKHHQNGSVSRKTLSQELVALNFNCQTV
jgi:hypothetical protein